MPTIMHTFAARTSRFHPFVENLLTESGYCVRWMMEILFRTLKCGCRVEE
jgi:hypothetical protein